MDSTHHSPAHQASLTRQGPSSFPYNPYVPGPFRPSGHFQPPRPSPPVPYSTGTYDNLSSADNNIDPALRRPPGRPPVRPSPSAQPARPVSGFLPNHTSPYPNAYTPLVRPQPISVQALLSHPAWRNGCFLGLPPRQRAPTQSPSSSHPAAPVNEEAPGMLFESLLVPTIPAISVPRPLDPGVARRSQAMDPAERERLEAALRQLACASSRPSLNPPHPSAVDADAAVHGDAVAAAASLEAELSAFNTQLSKPTTPEPATEPAAPPGSPRFGDEASSATKPKQMDELSTHSTEDNEIAQLILGLMVVKPTATGVTTGSRRSTPDEPEEDDSALLPPRKRRAITKTTKVPASKAKAKAAPKAKRAPAKGKGKAAAAAPPPAPVVEEEEKPAPKPKYTYFRRRKIANAPSPPQHRRAVTFAKEDMVRHFDGSSPVSGNSPPPASGSSSPLSPPDALPSALRRNVRIKQESKGHGVEEEIARPPSPKRARVTRATTARTKSLAAKAKAKAVESESSDTSEDLLDLIVAEPSGPALQGKAAGADPVSDQEAKRSEDRWLEMTSVWATALKLPLTSRIRSTLRPEYMSSDPIDHESDRPSGDKAAIPTPSAEVSATAPIVTAGSDITVPDEQPRQTAIPKPEEYRRRSVGISRDD